MDRRFPESTYRLQFHAGFTFAHATAIVPYLSDLGVTHLYASSYLKATSGSTHGYDVIDHNSLNPELGSEADHDALLQALQRHGMSHILDTVPNHVGVATNDNPWWNDVLEHGPASRYAGYFDIAWQGSPRPELRDKLLLPLLGSSYGDVLEKGELKLIQEDGKWWVKYYDRRFPIDPDTLKNIGDDVATCNGTPGQPHSFDRLHELLEQQHYRLSYWKVASDEINYRRFFDINDLAALSMERPEVFEATHKLIYRLIGEGKITGLRIDHPDGLYDPAQYFHRLQEKAPTKPLYVVVEKILALNEPLPADWPVHGTSGYDFLNMANGLFVDTSAEQQFTEFYQRWTGDCTPYEERVYRNKRRMLSTSLSSELHMLAHLLDRLAQRSRYSRDFTLRGLIEGLREMIACYPVYRSYITSDQIRPSDREDIERTTRQAIERNPKTEPSVFHFIRDTLLQKYPDTFNDTDRAAQLRFAGKFQQVTAPVTAKGIEDTTFYQYNRFISLNEVGGEPATFGIAPDRLHLYLVDRQARWPFAMSTLSTHDTKRSEDVRARLNVLSELPEIWQQHVSHWKEVNQSLKQNGAPSADEEYLLYQTLIGAWPLTPTDAGELQAFVPRVQAYMLKAMREAKLNTTWTAPNQAYEKAVQDFVAKVAGSSAFLDDFRPFHQLVSHFGLLNSLSQTLLKLTAPGVPDTYQGTELWDFSLVDPDNRRPVDYDRRRAAMADITGNAAELLQSKHDGRIKLRLHRDVLRLRRDHPGLFTTGGYSPLHASGTCAEHVFAFTRHQAGRTALVVLPRLTAKLLGGQAGLPVGDVWQDTTLPVPAGLRHAFTGQNLPAGKVLLSDLFADLPFAVACS